VISQIVLLWFPNVFLISFGRFWGKNHSFGFRFGCSEWPIPKSKGNKLQTGLVVHYKNQCYELPIMPNLRMLAIMHL